MAGQQGGEERPGRCSGAARGVCDGPAQGPHVPAVERADAQGLRRAHAGPVGEGADTHGALGRGWYLLGPGRRSGALESPGGIAPHEHVGAGQPRACGGLRTLAGQRVETREVHQHHAPGAWRVGGKVQLLFEHVPRRPGDGAGQGPRPSEHRIEQGGFSGVGAAHQRDSGQGPARFSAIRRAQARLDPRAERFEARDQRAWRDRHDALLVREVDARLHEGQDRGALVAEEGAHPPRATVGQLARGDQLLGVGRGDGGGDALGLGDGHLPRQVCPRGKLPWLGEAEPLALHQRP
jgi:hypothetical protein